MYNEKLLEYKIDKYNVINYLKDISKSYSPIPNHIIETIMSKTQNQKQSSSTFVGVYTILWTRQYEFNNSDLPTNEKYKKFFGLTDKPTKQILDKLEEIGVIVQQKKHRKKVIFVKYPEYVDSIGSITISEKKTVITETTERSVKLDLKDGQQKKFEKTTTDTYIDSYIEWVNNDPKQNKINNPTGFKRDVENKPDKYDFSDYENYLKKRENQLKKAKKAEIINQKMKEETEKINQERDERAKIFSYIDKLKDKTPEIYDEFYKKAYQDAKENNPDLEENMLRMQTRNIYLPKLVKSLSI